MKDLTESGLIIEALQKHLSKLNMLTYYSVLVRTLNYRENKCF